MSDLSRVEQLLRNALGEDIYEVTPQSRVETLLVELNELIEEMGSSVSPEAIATAVAAYLDEHLTNPTNPPVDTSLAIAGAAADAKKTGDEIGALKEDFTQMESDGVAPSAEQLLSKHTTADAVPYLFRKTGGDGADREYVDAIVGGTVAWNQIVSDNGKSGSHTPSNNSVADTTSVYTNFVGGHVYYISGVFSIDTTRTNARPYCQLGTGSGRTYGKFGTNRYANQTGIRFDGTIVPPADAGSLVIGITTSDGGERLANADVWHYDQFMAIDLTLMFGSEIANYIHNLDIPYNREFFTNLFTEDYYQYNAGELKSVEGVSAHETVGFNQWDEEWETGNISDDGQPIEFPSYFRSKNFIPALSETAYYFYTSGNGIYIYYYDVNYRYISRHTSTANTIRITPAGCRYMKFVNVARNFYDSAEKPICISLSDPAKNGTYEPYKAHNYPLDNSLTLRGISKLSGGKMYFDGDRYLPDGKVERRYGIVDLGTLNWTYMTDYSRFQATISDLVSNVSVRTVSMICSKYVAITDGRVIANVGDKCIYGAGNNKYIYVHDSDYTDATAFKTAMSGVILVYELATPTTEEATPYLHLQQCDPNGTEEFVSTGIIPVGHETRYPENLRAKIEGLPWDFSSLIAPTEKTTTASRNYTIGSLLIMGNTLYKVTANIANGGTIIPNTNVTATTLSEILSALAQ